MATKIIQGTALLLVLALMSVGQVQAAPDAGTTGNSVASGEIFAGWLRSAVDDKLHQLYETPSTRIESVSVRIPKNYRAPEQFERLEISLPYQNRSGDTIYVTVAVLNEGRVISRVNVMAEVRVSMDVVVATRDLRRNETLTAKDMVLEQRTVGAGMSRGLATDLVATSGMQVERSIKAGTPLRSDYLRYPLLVSAGDMVNVIAGNRLLRINTLARAKQDGNRGEWIRIQNVESKKIFNARVTGPGEVTVEF